MESFQIALGAVFPFIFYMCAGAFVRWSGIASEDTLKKLTTLAFRLLLPLLLFRNMYWADDAESVNPLFIGAAIVMVGIVIVLSLLIVPKLEPTNARRASIIQAIYRGNLALFAIPMGEHIYGSASSITSVSIVAFIVPLYNITATIILERYRAGNVKPAALVAKVMKNPLIIGILAGFALKFLHVGIPNFVAKPIRALGDCATPLAMLSLGGTMHLSSVKKNIRTISAVCGVRMILLPIVVILATLPLPLTPCERFMLLALFATPIATSSYPMAIGMGADGPLAGEMLMASNFLSMPTLFIFIFAFSKLGLF